MTGNQELAGKPTMTRRTLVAGTGSVAALLALGGVRFAPSRALVRPPGGGDEGRLLAGCIRCQQCAEVCPRRVVKPARLEDGIVGMRMPTMDFSEGYCDFCAEENDGMPLCAQVCSSGALSAQQAQASEGDGIGVARITTDWCLAYQLIGCRFCYDACPYDAIELDELGRPSVIAEKCNGCGACEAACVSLKEGSISIGATDRAVTVQAR